MKNINKKKLIIFGVVTFSLLIYFAIFSNFAEAQSLPTSAQQLPRVAGRIGGGAAVAGQFATAIGVSALNATKWGVVIFGVLNLLQYVLWWLISYGYTLLTAAVNMALDPSWFKIDAVLNGWRLVRDFANIWFILILLFIAIGTILRAQSYQAKKILPTLILVALVINFSLPITGFIIDFSNVISFQFLKAICPEVKNGEHCDFSANLENALDSKGFTQSLAKSLPTTENPPTENGSETGLLGTPKAQAIAPLVILAGVWKVIGIISVVGLAWDLGNSVFAQASPLGGVAVGPFVSIVITNIFLLLTAFVILSLAFLFLIRIASLIFLVILSPLGFAAAIIPATQKYSEKWWNYLFTQSFFAPFSLFFLWISLSLMGSIKDALTQAGIPYEFTSPANARIIFYIFSLMLMYGSIWIARQMGAMGADAVIKWWGSIQKGITGLASGLAGRVLVAPIGAAALGAGIPQAIGRISPLAGVKAKEWTEYLAKRGKAPEKAAAKAEFGMQLAPTERAKYFAKLDLAAKEAMLRKMKGDDRESLIASLPDAQKQIARGILGSYAFTGEEQLKSMIEKFKFEKNLVEQWKQFGTDLSPDEQKTFLLGIEDADKRAQFLDHVRDEAQKSGNTSGLTAFDNANKFLEEGTGFSANQRYANKLARFKVEHTEKQKVNQLASFFETLNRTPEELKELEEIRKDPTKDQKKLEDFVTEQKTRFKFVANDPQRLEILEAWKDTGHKKDLKLLQEWVNQMDPADQDKFYRDSIGKRATADAVVAFINAVDVKKKNAQGNETPDEERNLAIKKMVLFGASAEQLARVAQTSPELRQIADEIADSGKMPERNRKIYYQNQGRSYLRHGEEEPPNFENIVQIHTEKEIANELRIRNESKDDEAVKQIVKAVQKQNRIKDLDILTKVEFINKVDPKNIDEFKNALVAEIKGMSPEVLEQKITVELLGDERIVNAVFEGGKVDKLIPILQNSAKAKKLQEVMLGKIIDTMKDKIDVSKRATGLTPQELLSPLLQDKNFRADALAETFEKKFKNKELADELANLWKKEKSLSPVQKIFKKEIFG